MSAPRPYSPETLADRWGCSAVAVAGDDECWNWTGPVLRSGYGNAGSWYRKAIGTILSHRVAYFLAHGSLPPKPLVVRHTCDNRLCCNPRHLVPGTHTDNMHDMVERGRSVKGRECAKGEVHPRAKLSDDTASDIFRLRERGLSHRTIAARVGVSHVQVGRILRGESRPGSDIP